jgi:hypothetical protein
MWAAVAAAMLFAFYNAYETSSLQRTIREMQDSLRAQAKLQKEAAQRLAFAQREGIILKDPKSVKIRCVPATNSCRACRLRGIRDWGWLYPARNSQS